MTSVKFFFQHENKIHFIFLEVFVNNERQNLFVKLKKDKKEKIKHSSECL